MKRNAEREFCSDGDRMYAGIQNLLASEAVKNEMINLNEIRYYCSMNSMVFFDYIDLGDEEQLSFYFGDMLSKEMMALYERIKF